MQIVVIGGAQRSGTTLVQTLIANALPNAPLLPESHILLDLLSTWKRAKSEWGKTSRLYATRAQAEHYFSSVVATHIADIQSRYPATEYLVLKDPHLIEMMVEIDELLPGSTRVACLRDPRDIVASYLKIGAREFALARETRYSRREIDFICKKINRSYAQFIANALPPDVAIVSYEEIASAPTETLRRLAAETGLPLNPVRLDNLVWLEDEYRHQQEAWRTELEGRPPTPDHVGNFRQLLDSKEIAQVERVCRQLLDRLSLGPEGNGARETIDGKPVV
jgi:hypothetical protein